MAAKDYKVSLPGRNGRMQVHVVSANSAEQAARRVERLVRGGKHVVTQRSYVSDVIPA